MSPARRLALALLAGLVGTLGGAASARAAFDPGAEIVSVDNAIDEQGDAGVLNSTMTPDGRYVVFQTAAQNFFGPGDPPDPAGATWAGGIFRYDRQTGELALVADGDAVSSADGSVLIRGASNPSVSDNGQWVLFSTGQRLVPGDANDNVDVYARDMSKPVSDPSAFVLVSARDGASVPASYAHPSDDPAPVLSGQRNPGSEVWPATALSADGRFAVFRTVEWNSDLPAGAPPTASSGTPPGQVFVRDLQSDRTYLITQVSQPGYGAAGAPAGGARGPAVISADGSTIVWIGANAPAQTPFLGGESTDPEQRYYLLSRWRAGAPTIRITGLADPANPGCHGGNVSVSFNATGPCDGPLTGREAGDYNYTLPAPAVSADGRKIAYVATGELRPPVSSYINQGFDLFMVDLASPAYAAGGLRAATVEYTRAGNNSDNRATPPIDTVSMSRDGRHLGITSARVLFADPRLTTLGTLRANPDFDEAYEINLADHTLERVVTSGGGGDANGPLQAGLSLSADGGLVNFVSYADNLISGDANGVPDAFVANRTVQSTQTATNPNQIDQTTQNLNSSSGSGPPAPRFVTVALAGTGKLRLTMRLPGPGLVSVIARHGGIVARALTNARRKGTLKLVLTLSKTALRSLVKHRSLSATVTVTWSPKPPKRPLKQTLQATFRVVKHKSRTKKHHR